MDRIRFLDDDRHLTRAGKIGLGSGAGLLVVGLLGLAAGLLIQRLIQFDEAMDAGGDWQDDDFTQRWF